MGLYPEVATDVLKPKSRKSAFYWAGEQRSGDTMERELHTLMCTIDGISATWER